MFWLSSQRNVKLPDVVLIDKVAHAVAFMGLCIVARGAFGTIFRRRYVALLAAFLLTVLYGVTDEWHQSMVPTRTPDRYDLVADAVGGMIAVFLLLPLDRRRRGRRRVTTKAARA